MMSFPEVPKSVTLDDLEPPKICVSSDFFAMFWLRCTLRSEFSLKYTGDRQRQPAYEIKLWTNVYLDNRTNPIEVQGYRSKVEITGPDYRIFHQCEIGQKSLLAR